MNDFTLADHDCIGLVNLKNLRIRTGSDSVLSDQDWTRTKKFRGPLISVSSFLFAVRPAKAAM